MGQGPSDGRALAFLVNGKALALPAHRIAEVMAAPPITRVPLAPPGLRGLANVRGKVTPILALDVLFGAGGGDAPGQVVVLDDEVPVGLMVDQITGLATYGESEEAASVQWLDVESLLAQALPPATRRGAKEARSKPAPLAAASREETAFLTFDLADQAYGLALSEVGEVARVPAEIAALPLTGEAMLGAADMRGMLVPVVSLRTLLGFSSVAPTAASRLVVIHLGGAPVALLVDGVRTIIRAAVEDLASAPEILNRGVGEARIDTLIRGKGGLVAVLTPAKVFDEETVAAVAANERAAAPVTSETADEVQTAFVEFTLGVENYGFPLDAVVEIVRKPASVTAAPHAPAFLVGLMSHRGAVIPLIDQRRRFGAAEKVGAAPDQVIVTRVDGVPAGLVVDAVEKVFRAPIASLSPTAGLMRDDAAVFDRVATEGRLLLIVDPRELLDQAERDIVREFVAHAKSAA